MRIIIRGTISSTIRILQWLYPTKIELRGKVCYIQALQLIRPMLLLLCKKDL